MFSHFRDPLLSGIHYRTFIATGSPVQVKTSCDGASLLQAPFLVRISAPICRIYWNAICSPHPQIAFTWSPWRFSYYTWALLVTMKGLDLYSNLSYTDKHLLQVGLHVWTPQCFPLSFSSCLHRMGDETERWLLALAEYSAVYLWDPVQWHGSSLQQPSGRYFRPIMWLFS